MGELFGVDHSVEGSDPVADDRQRDRAHDPAFPIEDQRSGLAVYLGALHGRLKLLAEAAPGAQSPGHSVSALQGPGQGWCFAAAIPVQLDIFGEQLFEFGDSAVPDCGEEAVGQPVPALA